MTAADGIQNLTESLCQRRPNFGSGTLSVLLSGWLSRRGGRGRRGEPFPRPHGHRLHMRARSGMPPAVERRDDETGSR